MINLPQGDQTAASALLRLHQDALVITTELTAYDETLDQATQRLHDTYGTINVPVGVSARALVSLMRSVISANEAVESRSQVAEQLVLVATSRPHYGPAHRQPVPTVPV